MGKRGDDEIADGVLGESLSAMAVSGTTADNDTLPGTLATDSMGAQTDTSSTRQQRTDEEEALAIQRLKRPGTKFQGSAAGRVSKSPDSKIGAVAVPGIASVMTDNTVPASMMTSSIGETTGTSSNTHPSQDDHSDHVPPVLVAKLVPDDDEMERRLQMLEEQNLRITAVNAVAVKETGIDPDSNNTSIMGLRKRTFWCLITVLLMTTGIVLVVFLTRQPDDSSTTAAINQLWLSVGGETTKNPAPSQYQALQWLVTVDEWMASLDGDVPTQVLVERYALVVLFMSIHEDSRPYDLNSTTSVCSWFAGGIVCDENNEFVRELKFPKSKIQGTIPTEVGLLTSLVSFNMSRNEWSRTLPTELGQLTSLNTLDVLQNKGLRGAIPTEFGRLTALKTLNMSSTGLTGTIPTEMGLLTNLEYFALQENNLPGTIPTELGNCARMKEMWFRKNSFTGPLPTELSLLMTLKTLDIFKSDLTGTIPTEMGLLTNMEYLNLGENSMTGTIPTELAHYARLSSISFDQNQFTGTPPSEFGRCTSMTRLSALNNSLSGTIPTEIGRLINMTYFDVGRNEITGTIPTELGKCTALVQVGLHVNQLSGNLTDILCGRGTVWNAFESDCNTPNVTCSCCTECCDANQTCT